MKKSIIFASLILLSLYLSSCTKELDNPREGATDFNTFYKNATVADAQKLIAGTYNIYFSGPEEVQIQNFFEIISDDITCGGGKYADNANRYRNADELTCQPSDWLFYGPRRGYSLYQSIYKCIYQCNLIIDKIPETNNAEINRIKAEAMFLRAVALFEGMRVWHDIPFADHIYTSEDMLAPNGDPAQMIDWVLSNLSEAAKILPAVPGKGQQSVIGGRATSGAALAFYGKAALWYGTQYNNVEYVKKAIDPLNTIIKSNLYDLIANPKDLFRVKSDFCQEYIFERNCAETASDKSLQNDNRQTWRSLQADNVYIPKVFKGYGWAFCNPSVEFVDFMKEHDGADNVRFEAKLMSYDQLMDMEYSDQKKGIKPGAYYTNHVGYWNATALMWNEDLYTETGNNFYSRANNPIIRFAEVLLMYAEAQFVANGDSDRSGLAALNRVRVRAQLPEISSLTLQNIIDERRAELFSENERWFDIIRWRIADKVLANAGTHRYSFLGYKEGTKEYKIDDNGISKGEGHGWEDKYWELPFGTNQLQANPNLKQHNGW